MIGDKFLNAPRTMREAKEIYNQLGLKCSILDEHLFQNASELASMNNEIYDKHKNITWLKERIGIINHSK